MSVLSEVSRVRLALASVCLAGLAACAQTGAVSGLPGTGAAGPATEITNPEPSNSIWQYGAPRYADTVTQGGKGGEVIRVTSLASSGPGSLRAALQASGPRVIVFEVAGIIDLGGDNITIDSPFVTLAGQTAPSPGVSIIRGGLIISTHDVIVQHIRIRPGDLGEAKRSGRDIDSITTIAGRNIIVDHCSLSWATDENLSASGPRFTGKTIEDWRAGTSSNVLFSNNIIAEGLADSTHAKGEHSKGSLIHDNTSRIVIYANLYASNHERSPLFKGGVQGSVINNLIYNPGQRAVHYNLQGLEWAGETPALGRIDLIGNAMKAGPSTAPGLPLLMIAGVGDLSAYIAGNSAVDRWGNPLPVTGKYTTNAAQITRVRAAHFSLPGLEIMPATRVEAYVLANVGARPWDRDGNDVRVLADTAESRGDIIDSQSEVGGYPAYPLVRRAFDVDQWDLSTMAPRSPETLDASAGARGT